MSLSLKVWKAYWEIEDVINSWLGNYQSVLDFALLLVTIGTLFYLIRSIHIAQKTLGMNRETLDTIRKDYQIRFADLDVVYIGYSIGKAEGELTKISIFYINYATTDNQVEMIGISLPNSTDSVILLAEEFRNKLGIPKIPHQESRQVVFSTDENCHGFLGKDLVLEFFDGRKTSYNTIIRFEKESEILTPGSFKFSTIQRQ